VTAPADNPGFPLGGDDADPALADDTGATFTYGELRSAVDAAAAEIAHHGGGVAFIGTAATAAVVIDVLACLQAGVAAVLLGPSNDADLARLAAAYRPDIARNIDVPTGGAAGRTAGDTLGDGDAAMRTALLLPTSGSTGSPKFARISLASLVASARSIAAVLGLGAGERGLANLPLHYSYGLSVVVSHLVSGATVVLTGHSAVRPELWDVVRNQQVTSIPGVPYSYHLYRRVGVLDMDLPHLRTMTQAGGRLDPAVVRELHDRLTTQGRRLFVMYGQTEATSRMSVLDPADLPEHAGSVGHPVPSGAFRIAGPGDDGVGEVLYSGPNVMLGYAHGRDDLAKPDELGGNLATGDLGRLDDGGRLWLTGRIKRIVKLYGERVSLDDIEALASPWGIAVATDLGDDRLGVFVEGRVPADASRSLERQLGVPPRTVQVVALDALPRTSSGKVDYTKLGVDG